MRKRKLYSVLLAVIIITVFMNCVHYEKRQKVENFENMDLSDQTVSIDKNMISIYDKDIEYLKTLPQSEKAVEALENIKKLLVKNKLRISACEDIFSYNKNLEIYADFINTQTEEVVDRLSSLE